MIPLGGRPRFSDSLLWEWQRQYFLERGVRAWALDEVPSHVTNSPVLAQAYAEMVFAFLRDWTRNASEEAGRRAVTICELGSGSGRFAYHFLTRLSQLEHANGVAVPRWRYVLTDFVPGNQGFWLGHPKLRRFVDKGVLDVAVFDADQPAPLTLRHSGVTLGADGQARDEPVVLIANYFFDSIRQELLYFGDDRCDQVLLSLFGDQCPPDVSPGDALGRISCVLDYEPFEAPYFHEPCLNQLVDHYRSVLSDAHVLLPSTGLRCLRHFQDMSSGALLVLAADKGDHSVATLAQAGPPAIVHHGSVSLPVNFHALRFYCEQQGGLALVPTRSSAAFEVVGLLFTDAPQDYTLTRQAYERTIDSFGPGDVHALVKHAAASAGSMPIEAVLASLRMAAYDPHLGCWLLARMQELGPQLSDSERRAVRDAADALWECHFPIGEAVDLADGLARVLYGIGDYGASLTYFERSVEMFGPYTGTLCNMAYCLQLLGLHEEAQGLLRGVLDQDLGNEQAAAILATFMAEADAAGCRDPAPDATSV